jgi:hypothetical protein
MFSVVGTRTRPSLLLGQPADELQVRLRHQRARVDVSLFDRDQIGRLDGLGHPDDDGHREASRLAQVAVQHRSIEPVQMHAHVRRPSEIVAGL